MDKDNHDESMKAKVLKRIGRCFSSLAGSSGHLACYYIDAETFNIDKAVQRDDGTVQYYFSASAQYESEFTVYDENTPVDIHPVSGSIVLNRDFDFVYNEKGEVLLEPYKTIVRKKSPEMTKPPEETKPDEKKDGDILTREEVDELLRGINS